MKILIVEDSGWFQYRGQVYKDDKLVYENQCHTILQVWQDIGKYLNLE